MKTIRLYGSLGDKFGKVHKLNVHNPVEAIKALSANFPEFRQELLNNNQVIGYKIYSGASDRSYPDGICLPADGTIRIVPIIQGSGKSFGMILVGVFLIWATGGLAWAGMGTGLLGGAGATGAAAGTAAALGTVSTTGAVTLTTLGSVVSSIGVGLVLSGVSSLLYSPPKLQTAAQVEQNPSAAFNGPINVARQGNPVPLAYGKIMTGSVVISAGIKTTKVQV